MGRHFWRLALSDLRNTTLSRGPIHDYVDDGNDEVDVIDGDAYGGRLRNLEVQGHIYA